MEDIATIVQRNATLYLNHIENISNIGRTKKKKKKNGGFPILAEDNKEYYTQSFFDEQIENSIWKYLVNGILNDLFKEKYGSEKEVVCEWTPMLPHLSISYIEKIEKHYSIEFIIIQKGRRIGYRYTDCFYNEAEYDALFTKYALDKVVIIDFSSEYLSASILPFCVPQKIKEKITKISLEEFFNEFFTNEDYRTYVSLVREVVSKSYRHVGIRTVTSLTSHYLPHFLEFAKDIIREYPYDQRQYSILSRMNSQAFQWFGQGVISDNDLKIINFSFINKRRYEALTGSEDFAHSFITSEYLYQTLGDYNRFDYTAIVTGYLKSIEQLLYKTINVALNDNHIEDLWIQARRYYNNNQFRTNPNKRGKKQVKFTQANVQHFDTSFAAMVYLLNSYENGWAVSKTAKDIITAYLLTFCDECRNEHFHKDNINDIKEVEKIRNNAYMLMYYILGGYNYSKASIDEKVVLGIIDNSFERMYHEIMRFGTGSYYRLHFDSNASVYVALPMKQIAPSYDENGLLLNRSIRFVRLTQQKHPLIGNWSELIENEFSSERIIELRPDNMPTTIYHIDTITHQLTELKW